MTHVVGSDSRLGSGCRTLLLGKMNGALMGMKEARRIPRFHDSSVAEGKGFTAPHARIEPGDAPGTRSRLIVKKA